MPIINSVEFKKKHKINKKEPLSLEDIADISNFPLKALKEVYQKGIGAYYTNPQSVRPNVKSPQQWGFARVYSFVMKRKSTFYEADRHIAEKYKLIKSHK
jgi:hypothetical protein